MERDFQRELKERLKKIDAADAILPAPLVEPKKKQVDEKLFNIHKRSLPVGIDKIVVFGVTEDEAVWLLTHKLKARSYENEDEHTKTLIYFDLIPQGAKPREKSVYYNPAKFIKDTDQM